MYSKTKPNYTFTTNNNTHQNKTMPFRFNSTTISTIVFLLSCCAVTSTHGFFGQWGPDLAGPWCATRPPGIDCCDGRDDVCGVPILGTECYCDRFCNDTSYDCCPDYWSHCRGGRPHNITATTTLPPPRSTRKPEPPCYDKNGNAYKPGEITKDNCNTCTCTYDQLSRNSEFQCTDHVCLIRPELIRQINDGRYTWKASNYSKFWGKTLEEGIRYRLGTFLFPENVLRMTPLRVEDDVLPELFDAREKWKDLLHPITDQGNCASSWAHSTTAVASDRLAIETSGAIKVRLSAQNLLSCNSDGQEGCEGGRLDRAWWYLRKRGVVTEECYPYTSGDTDKAGQCLYRRGQKMCPSGIEHKSKTRYKATPPYRIRPLEREIMKEIMDNGPAQATIEVREDFFMYKHGIYKYAALTRHRGEQADHHKSGFHSIRIIGWGAERTMDGDIIKYWTCANSWGSDWGEDGYFRILRGHDESRIERYVVGTWGKISGDKQLRRVLMDNRRRRHRGQRQRRHLTLRRQRRRERKHRRTQNRRQRHYRHRAEQNKNDLKSKKSFTENTSSNSNPYTTNSNKMQLKHNKKVKSKKMMKSKKVYGNGKNKLKTKNKNKSNVSQFYDNTNLQGLKAYFPEHSH